MNDDDENSVGCTLCAWLCNWLCGDTALRGASLWDQSWKWDRDHSNESELWSEETAANRDLIDKAKALGDTDPEGALSLYREAAEAGSIWGMQMVAWHYDTGTTVEANFWQAQEYYYRALGAGSWMATIRYARLLARHDYFDYCERVLEDGVRADFIPAYFWLAWFRYKQTRSRKTCREVRALLEYAADKGHPGSKWMLARWLASGKFGLREIPKGLRAIRESIALAAKEETAGEVVEARSQPGA